MPSFLHLQRTAFSSPTDRHFSKQEGNRRHVHLLNRSRDHEEEADVDETDDATEEAVPDDVARHHTRTLRPNQCCSAVVQRIDAPASEVWSVIRRFDKPQAYKHFLRSCRLVHGDGGVGSLREVRVVSGLPAGSSTERLEMLDEERHVISFSVVGGDHRLRNYRSVTTLHQAEGGGGGGGGTVVVESYVVDIPEGNTKEDTCNFIDTIVRCNLQSLARIVENLAREK